MKKNEDFSSDSEDEYIKSRIGQVPLDWYRKEDHLGYTDKGKAVPKLEDKTQLDKLIQMEDNKNFWRTIEDQLNSKVHVLSKEQIELIQKIRKKAYISDYIKNKDYTIDPEVNPFPMYNGPVSKKKFMPSEFERKKINKIVHAIKMGWMKPRVPKEKTDPIEDFLSDVHDVWVYKEANNFLPRIPPPKLTFPHHNESFNPAPEYFEEKIEPKTNLRSLESSQQLIQDRFERLMSLYLAPRVKRKKIEMKAEDLLEKLPDLNDFKPFPIKKIYDLKTDFGLIVSHSMNKNDSYFAVADEFNYVAIFDTLTTRKVYEFRAQTENLIKVQFLSNDLLMVVCEEYISFLNTKLNHKSFEQNKKHFQELFENHKRVKQDTDI